jgi:hypothetical protein
MANVKVGPFRFEVRDVPKLVNDEDEPVDGYLDHSRTEILLDADLSNDSRLATLIHEIVHEKVEIQCGHNLRDDGLIDAIAFSWIEVMRDNPDLVKLITK